jgi:hypothetical protein
MVQRKFEPSYSTSGFIGLLAGGSVRAQARFDDRALALFDPAV